MSRLTARKKPKVKMKTMDDSVFTVAMIANLRVLHGMYWGETELEAIKKLKISNIETQLEYLSKAKELDYSFIDINNTCRASVVAVTLPKDVLVTTSVTLTYSLTRLLYEYTSAGKENTSKSNWRLVTQSLVRDVRPVLNVALGHWTDALKGLSDHDKEIYALMCLISYIRTHADNDLSPILGVSSVEKLSDAITGLGVELKEDYVSYAKNARKYEG